MAKAKLKGGKPIGRQKEARKRKMANNPYFHNFLRKKLKRVRRSNGLQMARQYAREHGLPMPT